MQRLQQQHAQHSFDLRTTLFAQTCSVELDHVKLGDGLARDSTFDELDTQVQEHITHDFERAEPTLPCTSSASSRHDKIRLRPRRKATLGTSGSMEAAPDRTRHARQKYQSLHSIRLF